MDFWTALRVVKIIRSRFQSKRRGTDGEPPRLYQRWMLRKPQHHPVYENVWSAPNEGNRGRNRCGWRILTITAITLSEVDGDPKRINDAIPSLECNPPTQLEDSDDQEKFEPILESGEGEQDGSKGSDGRFCGEGVVIVCEVCWEVV